MGMMSLHINKRKAYVNYMLSQQQWSGLTKEEIERWLSNFKDLPPGKLLLVYKLLTNLLYFSEKDVLEVLKEGVYNCLCYKSVLEQQKNTGFGLSQQALSNIYRQELRRTCFIPLLDKAAPHESGNSISRLLVQQGIVQPTNSKFAYQLPEAFSAGEYARLVIVDDCVGSGNQFRSFWEGTRVKVEAKEFTLAEISDIYNIEVNYLVLFGYDNSIARLREEFKNIKIHCVRLLSDEHRVFSDKSYIWKNEEERNEAKKLFEDLIKETGITLYGYKKMDFAFIMHQTIPNWSLPIFWRETSDWKLLMRRKDSNG